MENNENEAKYASLSEMSTDLSTGPADWTIGMLLDYIDRGFVVFPDFQRNYVWDKNKASRLIESFALDFPVPQLYLYKSEKNKYQVIDGQQRILSLYFFRAGRFPRNSVKASLKSKGADGQFIAKNEFENDKHFEDFVLKFPSGPYSDAGNPLNNKTYDNLDEDIAFGASAIRIMIITNNSNSNESIYEVYNRLNSGGVNLNGQEIRMSIGMSEFMRKLVDEINPLPAWQSILGRTSLDPRFRDLETLLRLCAAGDSEIGGDGIIEYQAPMNRFLNRYAETAKKFDESQINERMSALKHFIFTLRGSNGAYIREGSKTISRPILEGLYGAFYKSGIEDFTPNLISEIINDDQFYEDSLDKTTAKNQYEGRIVRAMEIIAAHVE